MTTANDLITSAFRRARVIGKDQTPAPDEAADALNELNRFLDSLWVDKLSVYRILVEQFALVAGQQSYTMGAGGNFNTTRPVKVVPGCRFTIANGVDRQLGVLTDRKQWDEIPYKAVQAPPQVLFADEAYPLANILFYPTPDQAYAVYINSYSRLQNVAALTTALSLPPGYEDLLLNGLAVRIAPEYGLEAPVSVQKAYARARRALALINYEMPMLSMPAAVVPRPAGRANILSGDTI